MLGINPATLTKILAGVVIKELASGKHGAIKVVRDKIIIYAANNELALAKAMAKSIAQQDEQLYNKLKEELHEKLSDKDWQAIFTS